MQVEVSQLLTILGAAGSTALTLIVHGREFKKEKSRTLKEYGRAEVEAEGMRRDIRHLQGNFQQMSANIKHIDDESEERFRRLDSEQSRQKGALEVLMSINRSARRVSD